ncbi:unnamed protein product [Adineta ricciae]|uniref:Uncharacterized protein n=1 Tax=Adineta ricciae TaxID=249248 RepID=A0A814TH30_ADIRI|nr:unnamed protein product [Adineta ricciae]CAF1158105.1 unnamed protein product [Adineta ricciae]
MIPSSVKDSLADRYDEENFVEVLEEPYHKPFIRNSRVNVFIAKLPRNSVTMYHRHRQNTIYMVIVGSCCQSQVYGSNSCAQEYVSGDCFSGEYRNNPLIHRVECLNESLTDAWFVGIEVLQEKSFPLDNNLEYDKYTPIAKVNLVGCRAYRLKLNANETSGDQLFEFSGIFISLTNGQLKINSKHDFPLSSGHIDRGHVVWFDGPVQFQLQNVSSELYEAILILFS